MAAPKAKIARQDASPGPQDACAPAPLASASGRAWLAGELAKAEREEARGPGGQGWTYNEALRPEIT